MKKPTPRTKFASDRNEAEHLLDCICWLQAENVSLDLDRPQEVCADLLKQQLLEGRLLIEFDEARDRYRMVPAPSLANH
jgi:hypothetical protein